MTPLPGSNRRWNWTRRGDKIPLPCCPENTTVRRLAGRLRKLHAFNRTHERRIQALRIQVDEAHQLVMSTVYGFVAQMLREFLLDPTVPSDLKAGVVPFCKEWGIVYDTEEKRGRVNVCRR